MNKKLLLIGVILLAIASAAVFLVLRPTSQQDQSVEPNTIETMTSTTSEKSKPAAQSENTPGEYIDYKSGIIDETNGTKILFFHAPWCPQCRDLESDIKSSGIPDGVTIIKVDYDTNQALRQKYGVTLQTTVVLVDDEGKAIKKFVAYDDPSLSAVKKNLL